ncbi:hypothetical protein ACS0TY_023890 [Phlomoides rotata]
MMSPSDKPYSTFELGKKLYEIWNVKGTLNLIPHSRGNYTIWFSSLEDRNCVFIRRHWVLQPGAIRLQNWVQDFNPNKPTILEALATALGTLIKIDDRTMHRRMGHYASLLVEIDMKNEMIEKIMGCGIVGHTTVECTRGRRQDKDDLKDRGRSTSGPKHTHSSSRRRCLTSRQRDTSIPLERNPDSGNHEQVDDVLHNNTATMPSSSGDKILALPQIPTKNTFCALSHNEDVFQAHNGDDTNIILVYKDDATNSPHLEEDVWDSPHIPPSPTELPQASRLHSGKSTVPAKQSGSGKMV